MYLQFEDMVYKYEETTKLMMDFIGMKSDNHTDKFKYFNPEISIKGTNLKSKFPKYSNDVKYIEENLKEYLYQFPEGEPNK